MKDKYFLDTNILVYSFDKSNSLKQEIAKKLIGDALQNFKGCISFQVIQEFLNVATQKFSYPLTKQDCDKYLTGVLEPLCDVYANIDLYREALEIKEMWQYSFYDSLIISAALVGGCSILYSEDFQHGQKIRDLVILNPFTTS